MFKKTYIAIIGNDEGQTIGSVVARGWIWYSSFWFYNKTSESISGGNVIDFKRIK